MLKVPEILDRVVYLLNDSDYDLVDKATYLKFISDALNQVLLVRPDANATTLEVDLVEGVKQTIPADGFRLIDVLFNINLDGSYSSAITKVEKNALDVIFRSWPSVKNGISVSNFAHDPTNPKVFWVTPGVVAGTKAMIVYSKAFPEVTSENDTVEIDIIFKEAIVAATLISFYSMSTESDMAFQKMTHYINLLSSLLGVEQQKGIDVGPREDK